MAFCANYGTAINHDSGFCGSCGKPVGNAHSTSAPAPQAAVGSGPGVSGGSGLSSNMAGALAYALGLITGVLFLVLEPYKLCTLPCHAVHSVQRGMRGV